MLVADPIFFFLAAIVNKIWIILGFALLIVIGISVSVYTQRKRRQEMAQAAQAIGFTFQDKAPQLKQEVFMSFHLFTQGYTKRFRNVMQGQVADAQICGGPSVADSG